MRAIRLLATALGVFAGLAAFGCAEKKTRSVSVEGPDSEVSLQLETTDKEPDKNE